MKKPAVAKRPARTGDAEPSVAAYAKSRSPAHRPMCDRLRTMIDTAMPRSTSKVWHGSPVWFIDDNPVVGYSASAKGVHLLFWNGKAIDDPALKPVGKYGAAQATFAEDAAIDAKAIRGWLATAKSNVFDSRAFFKRLRQRT